jgi:hypothetical protein
MTVTTPKLDEEDSVSANDEIRSETKREGDDANHPQLAVREKRQSEHRHACDHG